MSFEIFKRILGINTEDNTKHEDRYHDIDTCIQDIFDTIDDITSEPDFLRRLHYSTINNLLSVSRQYLVIMSKENDESKKEYAEKVYKLQQDLKWLKRMMYSHDTEFVTRQDGKGVLDLEVTFYIDDTIFIEGYRNRHEKRIEIPDRTLTATMTELNVRLRNNPDVQLKSELIKIERDVYNFLMVYLNFHISYIDSEILDNLLEVLDEYDNKNELVYKFESMLHKIKENYPHMMLYYGSHSTKDDDRTERLRKSKNACKKLIDEIQNKEV